MATQRCSEQTDQNRKSHSMFKHQSEANFLAQDKWLNNMHIVDSAGKTTITTSNNEREIAIGLT